jgi:hypothetical protein
LNGKVAAAGLENRDYGRGDPLRWPRNTLYQVKLALTSPKGCGGSVGIVRLRTKATEFFFVTDGQYQNSRSNSEPLPTSLPKHNGDFLAKFHLDFDYIVVIYGENLPKQICM